MKLIDLHCDTIANCMKDGKNGLKKNNFCVDIQKLKKAGSIAQFFALFVRTAVQEDPLGYCLEMVDKFYGELDENSDTIGFAGSYKQLMQNQEQNKISAFLTIEEGAVFRGQLHNLRNFYRLGVRLVTLIWNQPNELGYPNYKFEYKDKGLTDFGREAVAEMNKLGMLIDVSHASDQVFYDVAELSSTPFVASHSNARAVTHHPRNLTDKMLRILAQKGGVTGLNFESAFLDGSKVGKVKDMVRHAKHICKVGGYEVLAIGSDFDGTDNEIELKNIGEIEILHHALKKAGFTESQIDKLFYKNALRIIKDVLK